MNRGVCSSPLTFSIGVSTFIAQQSAKQEAGLN